jgi:N,N'-diacetyllegionaminate synthase
MLAEKFTVADRTVERDGKPYVIAEAGSNFNQSRDTARALIDVAAKAGADAVKFQLFKASVLYPDGGQVHDILRSVELDASWVPDLASYARSHGIAFLASAFDLQSLAVLEAVGVPAHKVASSEATNVQLLAAMARTGKPIFLATGMCDLTDVTAALAVIVSEGNRQVSLMQCGSVYPLPEEQANLRVIDTFASAFGGPVGFSDHTLGCNAAVAAVARGAVSFEKHFTLDRKSPGPDHSYALEPPELVNYVASLHRTHAALGDGVKDMLPQERSVGRREGLHARKRIEAGARLTADDIEVRRPATGIRARDLALAVGAVSRGVIEAGEPIRWTDIRL